MHFDCEEHGPQELTPFAASRSDLHRCGVCDLISIIPPRYAGASMADFDSWVGDEVAKYLETFGNLVVLGSVGTGKTHLAWSILDLRARAGNVSKYTTLLDMSQAIMRDRSADAFTEADFLIIDEMARGYDSPADERRIFEVVNKRYDAVKPTVFIGNTTPEQFKDAVGNAIADRINENVVMLALKGKSRRAA